MEAPTGAKQQQWVDTIFSDASRDAKLESGRRRCIAEALGKLNRSHAPVLDHTKQNHYDRNDQENMDESADRVRGNDSEKPKNNQDDGDGVEHLFSPFFARHLAAERAILNSLQISLR